MTSRVQVAPDVRLTLTQQRVLGYIAARSAIDDGVCCSKKDLSQMLHCSTKTVDRAIARLRRAGLIEVEERHLENGGQTANVYRIAR